MSTHAKPRLRRGLAAAAALGALAATAALAIAGCAGDLHARADMQPDAQDAAIDDHIYFSKEASSGGRSFAGGGCGCN